MSRTAYVGTAAIADGFAGQVSTVHLCIEPTGRTLAVYPSGWFTFADPASATPPLPVAERVERGECHACGAAVYSHEVRCSLCGQTCLAVWYALVEAFGTLGARSVRA